jgi:predicted alpha-1,6-mannanase (GH76 family)
MIDVALANARAAAAEHAVITRYVRRVGGIAWARPVWPDDRALLPRPWHYWWHAHLLDAAGDAARHRPSPGRAHRVSALARTVAVRTGGRWVNRFYDDIAWMGLALDRAAPRSRGIPVIARRLRGGIDPTVGALPWHVGSTFFNAPANGPAAILLARTGRAAEAARLDVWTQDTLTDPRTGLVRDGVEGTRVRERLYTYNQGTAIGAALALARTAPDAATRRAHRDRAASLVGAVSRWCTDAGGLLPASGGGDGGLFSGILCRYLADAARDLGAHARTASASARARELVVAQADALWDGRAEVEGRPFFSADPRRLAAPPRAGRTASSSAGTVAGSDVPDGDLSVQVGAWLSLEAAVDAAGIGAGITS